MPRQVFDRMTTQLVTIEPSTSVVEAAQRMIQQVKRPLPVVEGDRPIAMVTDRDIIARVVAEGRDPNSLTVEEIATGELVTITPDQDVEEARRLMEQHQLDRILVVERERLAGITPRCTSGPTRNLWPKTKGRSLQRRCRVRATHSFVPKSTLRDKWRLTNSLEKGA